MHVITKGKLRTFWEDPKYPRAKGPMDRWYRAVAGAEWHEFADVKKTFNSCDQVGSKVVYNVGGNHFRIVTLIDYESQRVYIRAVLDHKEYDKGHWKADTFGDDWVTFRQMIQERPNGKKP